MNLKLIIVIFGLLYILYDISNTIEGLENGGEDDGDDGDGGTNWTLIIIAIVFVGLLIFAGIYALVYYKKNNKHDTVARNFPAIHRIADPGMSYKHKSLPSTKSMIWPPRS